MAENCANHATSGQVLIGNEAEGRHLKEAFKLPSLCAHWPLPSVQHPELLKAEPVVARKQSCAEIAADYVVRLLVSRDLKRYATYFDLGAMSVASKYVTPEALKVFPPEKVGPTNPSR